MQQLSHITRRNALRTIGGAAGVGALGLGGTLLAGRAAALDTNFESSPITITSDRGDVDEVHLAPVSRVEWENFDEPVTKVRQLVEARLEDPDGTPLTPSLLESEGGTAATEDHWWPIWRESPWLFTTDPDHPDATGDADFSYRGDPAWFARPSYATSFSVSGGPGQKEEGTSGHIEYPLVPSSSPDRDVTADPLVYVVREGFPKPDYLTDYGTDYLTGVSIDGGGNYLNGSYGTVGDSSVLDNDTDGTTKTTTVRLRLTTTLHTDYDFVENVPGDDPENDRFSPVVMATAPDVAGDLRLSRNYGITYDELREKLGHPAVDVVETAFDMSAANEGSDLGSSTNANPGGS